MDTWSDALLAASPCETGTERQQPQVLRYFPLSDVAGAHSPLVGMARVKRDGTVTEGFVERLTGRVDAQIQIDQEECHGQESGAGGTTCAPTHPLSGCFDLCSTTLMVR